MRFVQRYTGILSSAVLISSLIACSSPTPSSNSGTENKTATDAQKKPVTIQYTFWGDAATKALHEQLADTFNKKNTGVTVEAIHVPAFDQYLQKVQTTMASGTAPDVINFVHNDVYSFASRDVLFDMTDWIKRDWDKEKLGENLPDLMEGMKYDGKQYALPRNAGGWYTYYNKTLFDKAGVKYPDESWTWETLIEAGKKLTNNSTNANERTWAIAFDAKSSAQHINYIWQSGGDYFNKDKTALLFDSPKTKQGLQFMYDLMYKEKIAPEPSVTTSQKPLDLFAAGKLAMVQDSMGNIPRFTETKDLKWGIAYLPKGPENRFGRIGATGLAIPKGSKNKEAAWEFIKYVNGAEGQQLLAKDGFSAPVRESILKDEKNFLPADKFPIDRTVAVKGYQEFGRLLPFHKNWTQIEAIAKKYLDLYFVNSMSLDEATKKIMDEAAPLMK
ncbi:ABC transporter substrate-binding protein [Paenibacillus sp. FSL H8-0034]|uniref:ABC transporter substrate-binding protein n=1 Tax=Paenibacillus sp. FSL H8-0034 TaxID=2954671 RepID=UPI0030F6A40E